MSALVSFSGVGLRFKNRVIFSDLNWVIGRGESWAVVGAGGSGKSCLSQMVSGDLRPRVGEVASPLFGYQAHDGRGRLVRLAFGGTEELTARHSPYLQARWYGTEEALSPTVKEWLSSRVGSRQLAVLKLLGVSSLLTRRMMQLSNGEFRKLVFAKALIEKPTLLILDDPFSGLDQQSRLSLKRALSSLVRDGQGLVLFVSRVEDVPAPIKNYLLLDHGKTRAVSGLKELAKCQSEAAQSSQLGYPAFSKRKFRSGKPLVEMKGITVRYGSSIALRNINWKVRENERWLVTGPNGSGKSTLLALILADHPQSYQNELYLFGKLRGSGESIWEIKERLGWLSPELEAHYPGSTTVLDTVCSGWYDSLGLHRPCPKVQVRGARQLLKAMGLTAARERLFGRLSAGEKRLTLLARAMLKRPQLLLLDEPTQGLDRAARTKVVEAVTNVCDAYRSTLVWVTHHPEEQPGGITHQLSLKQGRVVAQGPVRESR